MKPMYRTLCLLLVLSLLCTVGGFVAASAETESTPSPDPSPSPWPTMEIQKENAFFAEDGLLCVANRQNRLSANYTPVDLVTPNVPTRKKSLQEKIQLRSEAAQALETMFRAAEMESGLILFAVSGYRSYGIQQLNFSQKMASVEGNKDKAMRTVAPPGSSEHQLGLAMDIQSNRFFQLNQVFSETEEGKWLEENAHKFGFILRYKKEWRATTGYAFEPWHFRYVGVAHARAIKALNLPLEVYAQAASRLPEYVLARASDVLLSGYIGDMLGGKTGLQPFITSDDPVVQEKALREATRLYLPEGTSYEQALWVCYPTPMPTSAPRVDSDEETVLFSQGGE